MRYRALNWVDSLLAKFGNTSHGDDLWSSHSFQYSLFKKTSTYFTFYLVSWTQNLQDTTEIDWSPGFGPRFLKSSNITSMKSTSCPEPLHLTHVNIYIILGLATTVHTKIRPVTPYYRICIWKYPYPYDRTWVLADRIPYQRLTIAL
jgi:hypothetical protein